jgi:hypothetical protein
MIVITILLCSIITGGIVAIDRYLLYGGNKIDEDNNNKN